MTAADGQGRNVAFVPELLGTHTPGEGPTSLAALGPIRPTRERPTSAFGAEEEPKP